MNRWKRLLVLAAALAGLNSCNIFDPLDNPSGDAQLLSAARACFDQGDYECAAEHYGKLAGNEVAVAESAYMVLDRNNIGMAAFAKALDSDKAAGNLINALVKQVAPGAGSAKRQELLTAYKSVANIQTPRLRGFVRFITAMALAAEVWSEDNAVQADYVLNQADVVDSVSGCTAAGACDNTCDQPAGSSLGAYTATTDLTTSPTTVTMNGAASFNWIIGAIDAASYGLQEMGTSTGKSFTLISDVLGQAAAENCYRGALLLQGVGE